jgi:hypothetical protein
MNEARFTGFAGFWPFYVGEHREPMNRMMRFIGSSLGLVCLIATFVTGRLWLIPPGLMIGYGCAWVRHFFIERNRPATFKYLLRVIHRRAGRCGRSCSPGG